MEAQLRYWNGLTDLIHAFKIALSNIGLKVFLRVVQVFNSPTEVDGYLLWLCKPIKSGVWRWHKLFYVLDCRPGHVVFCSIVHSVKLPLSGKVQIELHYTFLQVLVHLWTDRSVSLFLGKRRRVNLFDMQLVRYDSTAVGKHVQWVDFKRNLIVLSK